jgi:predicted DNA-binding transcriptional regulator AlpA
MVSGAAITVQPLMTARDVAAVLGVGERTVWRLTSRAEAGLGRFPRPVRLAARTVRWRWEDVEKYLHELSGN